MHPHIYKKGKILNFKRLNEGVDKTGRNYIFSGKVGINSINTIVSSTNNLNQITGRILLGIYNLLSYFGLCKDPSEKLSKTPRVFDKFSTFYKRQNEFEILKDIKNLLIKQNERIERLDDKINHLSSKKSESHIFTSKLNEIEEYLKKILG